MPIVSECSFPGCGAKTIGPLCIAHDLPVLRTFPRGRPLHLNGGSSTVTQLPEASLQAADSVSRSASDS